MEKRALREVVESLRKTYQHELRTLLEDEIGVRSRSSKESFDSNALTERMNKAAQTLNGHYRTIIIEEIMNNKCGRWYIDKFSTSTYDRYRYKAYEMYIEELEQ